MNKNIIKRYPAYRSKWRTRACAALSGTNIPGTECRKPIITGNHSKQDQILFVKIGINNRSLSVPQVLFTMVPRNTALRNRKAIDCPDWISYLRMDAFYATAVSSVFRRETSSSPQQQHRPSTSSTSSYHTNQLQSIGQQQCVSYQLSWPVPVPGIQTLLRRINIQDRHWVYRTDVG